MLTVVLQVLPEAGGRHNASVENVLTRYRRLEGATGMNQRPCHLAAET